VIAFLESQGGTVDVTGADLGGANAAAPAPAATTAAAGGAAAASPKAIMKEAGCPNCHKISGEGGTIGPDLTHVGSRRNAAALTKKITDPASDTTKGFENFAGVMPKNFSTLLTPAQLQTVVNYLASHK
jgi:cytochrome c551/c552